MKRSHHDLVVWQEAIELVSDVYALTKGFPKEEVYGLTSQVRRAAVSVPSNIAESAARSSNKELLYFLHVARGSLSEVETQLIIAKKLEFIQDMDSCMKRIDKIFGFLGGLINSKQRGVTHDS